MASPDSELKIESEQTADRSSNEIQASHRKNEFKLGFRPALNGIRGFFILFVLLYHAGLNIFPGALLTMSIFFVLSGFLITALLMQEWNQTGTISFKQFYYRRALRLLPALFLLLIVCSIYALTLPANEARPLFISIIASLFYVANWIRALDLGQLSLLAHTWSLAVEEQFYIFLPLALGLILWLKLRRRWIILLLLSFILIFFVHTIILWVKTSSIDRIYYGTDTRMDQFLIGCLIGVLASWNILPKSPRAIIISKIITVLSLLCLIILYLTVHESDPFMSSGATTLTALATAAIIINLISAPLVPLIRFLELPVFVWIGNISYGIYLWHFPVFMQMTDIKLHRYILFILEVGITILIAALSYYYVELPFLKLKKRANPIKSVATEKENL